jgi:hypothetical protein
MKTISNIERKPADEPQTARHHREEQMQAVMDVRPLENLLVAAPWTEATYPISCHTVDFSRQANLPQPTASAYPDFLGTTEQ